MRVMNPKEFVKLLLKIASPSSIDRNELINLMVEYNVTYSCFWTARNGGQRDLECSVDCAVALRELLESIEP